MAEHPEPPLDLAPGRSGTQYAIGSLERALLVLEALAESPDLTLTDIVARVGASKATVFRHLRVLEQHGYVVFNAAKRYALGPKLLQLGHIAHEQLGLPRVAIGAMTRLRNRFDETVHLGVLMGDDVVHIESVPSTQPLKMAAAVGERTWAHVSALGKCLLAWREDELVARLVARGLPALTDRSLVTLPALAKDLEAVRRRGYSVDDEESGAGLRCVGAPVRDADDAVIAALSVSGPSKRLPRRRLPEIASELIVAAAEVSQRCGWPRPDPKTSVVEPGRSAPRASG